MKRLKSHLMMMLLVILSAVSQPASAEASAIATGSDGSFGWATRKDQKEANNAALKFCNEHNPKIECALVVTKAVVRAEGANRTSYGFSPLSLADAKKEAIGVCGNSCKVTFEMTKPGFWSLAKSETDKDGNNNFHLTYQGDDIDVVKEQAKQGCEKERGRKCTSVWTGAIPGTHEISSTPRHVPVASEKSCRPNTPTMRCTSKCTNGDCIVTYENSCQIRVQVQPEFEPFNNQWIYPLPAC